MKKTVLFLFAAALLAVSCNKEVTPVLQQDTPVRFTTNLNSYTVRSSSFSENDEIGVFAGAPISRFNVLGKVTSSQGLAFESGSEIYWQAGQTAATTFGAYYPYSAGCDATEENPFKFTFSIVADQTTAEAVRASDLLTAVAANVAVPTDPATAEPVTLSFIHQGAKLVVNVIKEISAGVVSVEILDTPLTGVVDIENQTVTNHSNTGTVTCFRPNSTSNTFEAILLPAEGIAPKIKVTVEGGTTYTYSMEGTMNFVAGKQYTAMITIAAQENTPAAAAFRVGDITDWEVIATPVEYGDTPAVVIGNSWGVVGLGGDWDNDLPMQEVTSDSYCWTIDITYVENDEFKFRYAKDWAYQFGAWEVGGVTIDQTWIDATTDTNCTCTLWKENNGNLKLPSAGDYTLKLYTGGEKEGQLFVTKN